MKLVDPPSEPTLEVGLSETPTTPAVPETVQSGLVVASPMVDTIADYAVSGVIGRGGMGEVVLAHDREIGRDVAIKRLRTEQPSPEARERFLREARIQARLDHPAVVPVYEIGYDGADRPYFTMKRLAGVTLVDVLENRSRSMPQQRLLRALADVCLAVEFAHARRIIHRDLKPANIMLGDYGEVYVLDWGLGRMLDGEIDPNADPSPSQPGGTEAGVLLGTPGYMSPEQVTDAARVGPPADVYALGSILFEILAGEPAHPRGAGAIASTLAGFEASPARRRPEREIAPELDALCVAALDIDAARRPTANRLAEELQRYLDGDRDVERRRALAVESLERANVALAESRRADAMRDAGRALALDPESKPAAELVGALLLEPPATPPPELQAALHASDAQVVSRHTLGSAIGFFAIIAIVPFVIWNGVLSWRFVGGVVGLCAVMGFVAVAISRSPDRRLHEMVVYLMGVATLLAVLGRLCGPFMFVPAVASFVTMSASAFPAFVGRAWLVVGLILGGWAAPMVFEQIGFLRPTWFVEDGKFTSMSYAIELGGASTTLLALLFTIATIVIAGFHGGRIARAHQSDRHRLVAQAWHLRQLLPAAAR